MLINDVGNSSPPFSFWVSTTANESLDAKVYKIKSLSKSVLLREGACAWGIHWVNLSHSTFNHGVLKNTLNFCRYWSKLLLLKPPPNTWNLPTTPFYTLILLNSPNPHPKPLIPPNTCNILVQFLIVLKPTIWTNVIGYWSTSEVPVVIIHNTGKYLV